MDKKIKFLKKQNMANVPLPYQFLDGIKLKKDGKFVDYTFEVEKYQSTKCYTAFHNKPISKIISIK